MSIDVDKTVGTAPCAVGDIVLSDGAPARAKDALRPSHPSLASARVLTRREPTGLSPSSACGDAGARCEFTTATAVLERVNVAPAQTWNRLRANDITLTVPFRSRKGDVYFALPRLFEGVECGMGQAVTDWVRSQAADARYVEVPARTRREEPIVVEVAPGDAADTGVMVREGAEATIVVVASDGGGGVTAGAVGEHGYEAASSAASCANLGPSAEDYAAADAPSCSPTSASLLRVVAEARAVVHVVELVACEDDVQHLESVGIRAGDGAHIDVRQYVLGGGTVAVGFSADLAGKASRLDLDCRYYAAGHSVLDVNHVARLRGRNARAQIAESGILDGAARKSLRATIDLVHGAKGAKGDEAETVLVLGDDVVNKTVPTILCDEDDVAGNHGATIGSVSPEQMGYLCDRGLSREEAEQLFVRALFEDAIMRAPVPAAHAAAVARAERVLGADVAHDFDEGIEA